MSTNSDERQGSADPSELIPVKLRRGTWQLAHILAAFEEIGTSDWLASLVAQAASERLPGFHSKIGTLVEQTGKRKSRGPQRKTDDDNSPTPHEDSLGG